MAREEHISCDNPDCHGGKHFFVCGNGHDICSLCKVSFDEDEDEALYCPVCLKSAELKDE